MATIHFGAPIRAEKLISAALWTAQVVLASLFAADGIINLTLQLDRLIEAKAWVASIPAVGVRVFGALEILGAVALMLPTASIALTRAAGVTAALFTLLILADALHQLLAGSVQGLPVTLLLAAICGMVSWERLRHHDAPAQ